MGNRRWSKFWWQDYERDPALRMCSLSAQGLWMRLLCIMHEGDPYGHLCINGRQPSLKQIGAMVSAPEKEVDKLLLELRDAGVFSTAEDGVMFSRRMVRDKTASEEGAANGKNGGNPALKTSSNNKDNPGGNGGGLTPPLKHQEERSKKQEKEEDKPLASQARASDACAQAVAAWNEVAERHGLARVARLTEPRRKSLRQRLAECDGIEGWHAALLLVTESDFLMGRKTDFSADFDFVIQQKSFTRLMEGSYANRTQSQKATQPQSRQAQVVEAWGKVDDFLERTGGFNA